jgi:hypothetical protein
MKGRVLRLVRTRGVQGGETSDGESEAVVDEGEHWRGREVELNTRIGKWADLPGSQRGQTGRIYMTTARI